MKEIEYFDTQGTKSGAVSLPFEMQRKEESSHALACAIRVLRFSWRQGSVKSKGRGDVSFSNRKPWKQKGTGRARAGSARSGIWRSGGAIFGPQPRTRTLSMPRKQLRLAMNNILFKMIDNKAIHQLDLVLDKPSTKKAFTAIKQAGLENKKAVFFVSFNDYKTLASLRNIPSVHIVFYDQPNVYDLANATCWVFLSKDADSFKGMVEKWN